MNRYPIYVPSKGRYDNCMTAKFLMEDGVPFRLVVEPQEFDEYASRFGEERMLVLPWSNLGEGALIAARNWIREHSVSNGDVRHWQVDDNIRCIKRRWKARRIPCNSGIAFAAVEDFVDRYENVAVTGLAYEMFLPTGSKMPPFYLNVHVYSCTLVLNDMPYTWRTAYNDDTDLCLQVLAGGWCTVLFNAFLQEKMPTMAVKGGNTPIYQGDGRLKMARSLERLWPGVVEVRRRWGRPQHAIKHTWRRFDTLLKLKPGITLDGMESNEYGMRLVQLKEIKSPELQELVRDRVGTLAGGTCLDK